MVRAARRYAASIERFRDQQLDFIPMYGPLSWTVPGCVDAWHAMLERFGTRPLAELLEPSIDAAERGVETPPVIAKTWAEAEEFLRETSEAAATFLVDGYAPRAGESFRTPQLAATLRLIARDGRDVFYRGEIAERIVKHSEAVGGLLSMRDLADHTCTWVEPVSTSYRGHDVWAVPPPGQGIAALQMLNLLEGFDLASIGHSSADWWHLFVEAKRLVYADRARYYADPDFASVPTSELISKQYADARRDLIDTTRAMTDVHPGEPSPANTICLVVVDKDRNCVSLMQSIYDSFGSRTCAADLGFMMHNRGMSFSLDPTHPNALAPHKRPFHTIIPGFVTKSGEPHFVFA
jgi:gamma-glutamyltranspeptidase/glutathione hydrolase